VPMAPLTLPSTCASSISVVCTTPFGRIEFEVWNRINKTCHKKCGWGGRPAPGRGPALWPWPTPHTSRSPQGTPGCPQQNHSVIGILDDKVVVIFLLLNPLLDCI